MGTDRKRGNLAEGRDCKIKAETLDYMIINDFN